MINVALRKRCSVVNTENLGLMLSPHQTDISYCLCRKDCLVCRSKCFYERYLNFSPANTGMTELHNWTISKCYKFHLFYSFLNHK